MKDSHGRTIDYLRISLTDRCNFRCIYCMPEDGVQSLAHEDILRIEEIEQAVRVAAGMGIRSIRLTGGEPLVRLGVVDLVRAIAHTPGIENVSMTTNGVLLPKMADDLKQAGLSRVNISLDTLDPAQVKQVSRRGELQLTLDGLEAAIEIRALDREDARTVPIIALTANTFQEDREDAAAAGMDGFIPKPFDAQQLYETLRSYLPRKG